MTTTAPTTTCTVTCTTTEVVAAYHRDGFVIAELFSAAEAAALASRLGELVRDSDAQGRHARTAIALHAEPGVDLAAASPGEREGLVRKIIDFGACDALFWANCRDPRLLALIEPLLGPAPLLIQSMAMVKPPRIGSAKPWHQDIPYFPIQPRERALGVWIALDPTDTNNGCMEVVPGSHAWGEQPHQPGPNGHQLPEALLSAHRADIRAVPLQPGSVLVFDARLWHGSGPNTSARRRRALQYHYVPAGTTVGPPLRAWALTSEMAPGL